MNRDFWNSIESHFEQQVFGHPNPIVNKYLVYLQLIVQSEFDQFFLVMQEQINTLRSQPEKWLEMGFCSIWWALASETQYNIEQREKALLLFHQIADENSHEIFEYYRQLFKAVGYAYQSLQIEAEACYQKSLALAEAYDYQRGLVRSLTGLGLIHCEMNNTNQGRAYLFKGLTVAKQNEWTRSIRKINQLLGDKQGSGIGLNNLYSEIKTLIAEGDLLFARRKLVEAEVLRRQNRLNRKAHSFYVLYAIISGLKGKHNICNSILRRLTDRVLKLEAILLLRNHKYTLEPHLTNEARCLEMEIYTTVQIQKIDLTDIRNTNVRQLLSVLAESKAPIDKSTLFENIFGIKYDPILHDAKLYKLIMQTRKLVSPDVIINHHGTYSFNVKKFKFVS